MGNASKLTRSNSAKPKSSKGIKIAQVNIVSLRKNKLELEVLINENKFDVIALNETRLNKNTKDRELYIDWYEIYRNDRDTSGGGVAMYVRSNLSHHCREDITDPNLEILGIEITPNHARSYIVLCWYRPPTSGIDNTTFEALTKILEKTDVGGKEIILLGDTNCDFKGTKDGNTRKLNLIYSKFQFEQTVKEHTRVATHKNSQGELKVTKSLIDHYSTNKSRPIGVTRGLQFLDLINLQRKRLPNMERSQNEAWKLIILNTIDEIRNIRKKRPGKANIIKYACSEYGLDEGDAVKTLKLLESEKAVRAEINKSGNDSYFICEQTQTGNSCKSKNQDAPSCLETFRDGDDDADDNDGDYCDSCKNDGEHDDSDDYGEKDDGDNSDSGGDNGGDIPNILGKVILQKPQQRETKNQYLPWLTPFQN